jgi:hypothetical protein
LAAFSSIDAGGAAVSDIIAAGIVPAAIEMMDALAIRAVEAAFQAGLPLAAAVLIVELDGPAAEVAAHRVVAGIDDFDWSAVWTRSSHYVHRPVERIA